MASKKDKLDKDHAKRLKNFFKAQGFKQAEVDALFVEGVELGDVFERGKAAINERSKKRK